MITDRIIQGVFSPGTRLVEEHLAREFGISRPPIRESFGVLEREGLVTISPRRGACACECSRRMKCEMFTCAARLCAVLPRVWPWST